MLNRRHIRIKILQLLYSKTTGKIDNRSLLKQFEQTSQNFYKLFLTQLILLKEIFKESIRVVDLNEKKYFKEENTFFIKVICYKVVTSFFSNRGSGKLLNKLQKKI